MKATTPMKAIRLKCLDCCCGSSQEVRLCEAADCPLHAYRFGHRPKTKNVKKREVNPAFMKYIREKQKQAI